MRQNLRASHSADILEELKGIWQNLGMKMIELPEYAIVTRNLECGLHPYRLLLPRFEESPAARRVETKTTPIGPLLDGARVKIKPGEGYLWVDVRIPAIMLIEDYYRKAHPLDLYLDLVHELTHLRQFAEGKNIWEHSIPYVDRITEIEGYALAVEEGMRLGMDEDEVIRHLSNPWMTEDDVSRLRRNIDRFLAGCPSPGK